MAVQKHNTYYDNELYYYDENGVRQPLQVGNVYSAGSGIKIENDIISVSGKYVASADTSLDGKPLVLKDNKWEELVLPPSSDWLPTIKEASANAYNATTAWTDAQGYLTAHQIIPSAKWENASDVVVSNSAKWNDGYNTLTANSADWMNVSSIPNLATKDELNTASSTLNANKLDKTVFDEYKDFVNGELPKKQDKSAMSAYALSSWVDENYQKKGDYLSANALDLISETSGKWNEVSSKLDKNYFTAWSANYDEYVKSIENDVGNLKTNSSNWDSVYNNVNTNSAKWDAASDEVVSHSANWNNVYETVQNNSAYWDGVSSKANSADLIALSGKVNDLSAELKIVSGTLQDEINVVSAEFENVVYTSATKEWDISSYSAGPNINITDHTISSTDWLPKIQEASANAVDVVKSKFNETQNGEFSGYDNTPFYVKQKIVSGTKPIIVNEYDDKYNIEFEDEYKKFIEEVSAKLYTSALPTVESLTPDYLKVDLVKKQDGTSAWQLSASEQKNYQAGDYIDIDENDKINVTGLHNVTLSSTDKSIGISATTGVNGDVNYNLSVDQVEVPDISGYNGIVASYNEETNQYEVGFKENDYAYLFGHYGNNSTVTDGTILKLDSNNYYNITIDEDGYITLPQTTNKFTFCINEYIDDNTTQNHEYLLNKLVLSAKNSDSIVASQNYYPSEVGSSNVTLALTIDNSISPKEYCIVYKGSDVAANKLKVEASILEEVTSLDSSRGEVSGYTGREPIRIVQNSRVVELLYDEDVFTLKEDASLGAKKLTIESKGGEVVNKETFDKLLNNINGRMTETIPFGALNTVSDIAGQHQYSYLFRPTIEYDMTKDTQAYMDGGNADSDEYVSVAVYQGVAGNSNLLWETGYTLIPTNGGQVVMDARVDSPSATITPDSLYYVCVRVDKLGTHGGTWHNVLGLSMGTNTTTDIGNPKPWVGLTNVTNLDYPSTQDFAGGSMSTFGGTKPYVGFRTKDTNN